MVFGLVALVHAMPKSSNGNQEIQYDTEYDEEIQPAPVVEPQSQSDDTSADSHSLRNFATVIASAEHDPQISGPENDASSPDHVNTIIKHIAVPYEREITIDNPILTPVENAIHIENPVPIVKFIDKPVPIHVDYPVLVPVIKKVHVPQPYIHKVHVILQKLLIEKPHPQSYKFTI